MYIRVQVQCISCVRALHALPLVQKNNVLHVPENDLFLVEDVNGDVAARVQII